MSKDHRVAIVTGASGGLSRHFAAALVQAGFACVLTARDVGKLETVATDICRDDKDSVFVIPSDARDAASVAAMVDTAIEKLGRIDVLVNTAASSTPIGGAIEQVDVNALIGDMDVKVGGYLRYTQAVVPHMKANGGGQIINIGGLTGRSSDTLSGLRNVAVAHFTKVLSDQLAPFKIAVNAINPGIVETPHLRELFTEIAYETGVSAAEVEADFTKDIPSGAILRPEHIGEWVAFLAQSNAMAITGQSLTIDGGYSRGIYI